VHAKDSSQVGLCVLNQVAQGRLVRGTIRSVERVVDWASGDGFLGSGC